MNFGTRSPGDSLVPIAFVWSDFSSNEDTSMLA